MEKNKYITDENIFLKNLSQHNKTSIVYLEKLTENSQHLRCILVKLFAFKDEGRLPWWVVQWLCRGAGFNPWSINFSIVNGNRYYSYLDVTKYGTHSIVSDVFQPKIFILNLIILFRSIFILLEVQGIREQVNVTRRRQWEKFVYRMSTVHLTQSMSGFDLQKTRCNVQSWLGPGLDKHVVKDILGTAGEI